MIAKQILNSNMLFPDYCGYVIKLYNTKYHYNKCELEHKFYNKEYLGEKISYCSGGFGYILSKKSINLISKDESYMNHVYEDVYIGSVLKTHSIFPTKFPVEKFFYDPILEKYLNTNYAKN